MSWASDSHDASRIDPDQTEEEELLGGARMVQYRERAERELAAEKAAERQRAAAELYETLRRQTEDGAIFEDSESAASTTTTTAAPNRFDMDALKEALEQEAARHPAHCATTALNAWHADESIITVDEQPSHRFIQMLQQRGQIALYEPSQMIYVPGRVEYDGSVRVECPFCVTLYTEQGAEHDDAVQEIHTHHLDAAHISQLPERDVGIQMLRRSHCSGSASRQLEAFRAHTSNPGGCVESGDDMHEQLWLRPEHYTVVITESYRASADKRKRRGAE